MGTHVAMSPLVLLLDEDNEFRYAVSRFLTREGFDVIALSSSIVALDVLDRFPVDALLVDIQQAPGQPHGFLFSRMAKRKRPELPCVFMSAYPRLGEDRVSWPDKLLQKPIDLLSLSAEIRALVMPDGVLRRAAIRPVRQVG